jgi:hypothetical protein
MSSTVLWHCAAVPALDVGDVGASMQAFRDRREAVQLAQSGRAPASSVPAQQDDADEETLDRGGSDCGSDCGSAGGSAGGGGDEPDGSDCYDSETPSETPVEDDLDRMEHAAETMRQARPPKSPRICTHDECTSVAALKVKSRGAGHGTGQLVCLEHALPPSMLFDLMRAVLQMDKSVITQYLQAQKDQGEDFGLCLDRAFAHFCTAEPPLDAVPVPAYPAADAGWKHEASTLAALARNMRVLLKGMKRDAGPAQLQAMLQQRPYILHTALELRDRMHNLMHDHQEQQEEDELMREMEEMEAIQEISRANRYIDEEAAEDLDSEKDDSEDAQ